jgi:hypothetical protein
MPGAMPTAPESAADRTILVRSFEIFRVFDRMSQTRGLAADALPALPPGCLSETYAFLGNWRLARPARLRS